jgi:hypothetical protein
VPWARLVQLRGVDQQLPNQSAILLVQGFDDTGSQAQSRRPIPGTQGHGQYTRKIKVLDQRIRLIPKRGAGALERPRWQSRCWTSSRAFLGQHEEQSIKVNG